MTKKRTGPKPCGILLRVSRDVSKRLDDTAARWGVSKQRVVALACAALLQADESLREAEASDAAAK